tara:strand:- start:237 stop:488 length:252 start_codon:yes stop_codon:yes gene_type:complete
MSAIRTKRDALMLEIGGRQAEVPVVIKWIIDPGSLGAHDEPPCAPFAEILTIRLGEIDIAPMLPKSIVYGLAEDLLRGAEGQS